MTDTNAVSKNGNLHNAKKAKNDEFYTQLSDIENELKHYRKHFKDQTILCNCDDPYESNFFKYFVLNFNRLKLKKLIATCYATSPVAGSKLSPSTISNISEGKPYKAVITTVYDATGDGQIDMDDVTKLFQTGENTIEELEGNGDFRSAECLELMDEADIVVTNPPFSLFREYVATLVEREKKFLIIGNQNAITYKEIFPLLKENEVWWGCGDCIRWFLVDKESGYKARLTDDGKLITEGARSRWFTNLDHKKRHEELICVRRYEGNESAYPHYDNYDAIEVSKVVDIPLDYRGAMGVPITFMDKYCPEQFELIGITNHGPMAGIPYKDGNFYAEVDGKRKYIRLFICYTTDWIQSHPEDFNA